jgi:nucleotide-binding universal stress UspA family protein
MKPIVHTTDLHDERVAFEHSVALARAAGVELVALHANGGSEAMSRMPEAGSVLVQWGADPQAVAYRKLVHECCEDPVETVLDALRTLDPALVVASTHRRGALARFFAGSRAEAIAHNVTVPALLLPQDVRGFVSAYDGSIALDRILVPVGDATHAAAAVAAALWLVDFARVQETELVLLHVGHEAVDAPVPSRPGTTIIRAHVPGGAIEAAILDAARSASAIVMVTHGHDSPADVLLGSHTDRVLHQAPCAVLSVAL